VISSFPAHKCTPNSKPISLYVHTNPQRAPSTHCRPIRTPRSPIALFSADLAKPNAPLFHLLHTHPLSSKIIIALSRSSALARTPCGASRFCAVDCSHRRWADSFVFVTSYDRRARMQGVPTTMGLGRVANAERSRGAFEPLFWEMDTVMGR
jgi:hypothetical protein